jgi:uncharacterized 2Fe-2S/4Fe-4S cluster protein (DUF4445 family)
MNPEIVTVDAADLAGCGPEAPLSSVLESLGHPLNTRCGGRGLCRGCMVDLLAGGLVGADGVAITAGAALRSCQARLPAGGRAVLRIHPQASISRVPQVGETFAIDVPVEFDPPIAAMPGRDTAFGVDVGTTTVVVLLLDLASGEILSRAGAFSAQIRFGDNVITRIGAAASQETRHKMRAAVVAETLVPLLEKTLKLAGREPSRLACGALAGNTTMLHILADEDPTSLGIAPFTARFLEGRMLRAGEVGLAMPGLDPETPMQLLPGLSAYVGADITAGVHATGMTLDPAPSLLVDMGTNGEVVLNKHGRLLGCATAAGPAFEGAGLSSGTRAQDGAVSGIRISAKPFLIETEVIGGKPAQAGICGSAYIDFLALARRGGLLRENGRFDHAVWATLPANFRAESDNGLVLRLNGTPGPEISEVDIAHLLQAKAAIGSGIETLLHASDTAAHEIGRVYLAGGFGMHLDVAHAIAIGLLPGFRTDQVRVVGNTSLAGTVLALIDRNALVEMEALRRKIEVIELNLQADFEDRYIDHLSLV